MSVLEARALTKVFPGVVALDSVDIAIESGQIHCIIGENGAGKSTLIKCLTGVYTPEAGDIVINGNVIGTGNKHLFDLVAYAPQELDLFLHMSVAENLFLPFERTGIKGPIDQRKLVRLAKPVLEKFRVEVDPAALVKDIPVSARQLLQIARATLAEDFQVLLLDEPTTSLTQRDAGVLFDIVRAVRASGKSVIFISHKLPEIFALGDVVSVFRNGKNAAHAKVDEVDEAWVVSQMTGRELDQHESFRPKTTGTEVVLDIHNLTGRDFRDVSLQVRQGEILGLYGLVGAGRSELMQAVFGHLPVYSGTVSLLGKPLRLGRPHTSIDRGLVYLSEERKQHGILPWLSVRENSTVLALAGISGGLGISRRKEQTLAQDIVTRYDVKTPHLEQQIRLLSGGNQQKVVIGRAMAAQPKVIIFDEPTKGIDVGTKAEIYRLMKELAEERGVGIVLISSEIEEIRRCASRIVVLYDGHMTGEFGPESTQDAIMRAVIGGAPAQTKELP